MSVRLAPLSCLHIPGCWVLTAGRLHELEWSGRSSEQFLAVFSAKPRAHDESCTKQLHNVAAAGRAEGTRMHPSLMCWDGLGGLQKNICSGICQTAVHQPNC